MSVLGSRGRKLLASAALATATLVLSGCAILVDEKQARVCRSVVPALHPPGTAIRIDGVRSAGDGRTAVRVAYRATPQDTLATESGRHWAVCRFESGGFSHGAMPELASVITDRGVIGEVRLALLKLYWLPEAQDPAPMRHADAAPEVPRQVAVVLQQVLSSLPMIGLLGLLSAAYALIYGLIGRLSLVFGEMAALASYASMLALAMTSLQPFFTLSLAVAGLAAVLCGVVHGGAFARFVLVPLGGRRETSVLIATVGLSMAVQEYLRLMQGPTLVWVPSLLNAPLAVARSDDFVVTATAIGLLVAWLALVQSVLLLVLMRHSSFGRHWRAAADDELAYAMMGLDARRMVVLSAMLAAVLASMAGLLMTVFYGRLGYAGGYVLGLKALVGAVVGGLGSVPGALAGGMLIGVFEALWSACCPIEQRDLAVLSLLAVFLVLRREGLAGSARER